MIVYGPLFFKSSSNFYLSDECSIIYLSSIGCYGNEWSKIIDKVYPKSYKNSALFVFLEIDELEREKRRNIRSTNKSKIDKTDILKANSNKQFIEKKGITSVDRLKAFTFWKKYLTAEGYRILTLDVTHLTAEESASKILDKMEL